MSRTILGTLLGVILAGSMACSGGSDTSIVGGTGGTAHGGGGGSGAGAGGIGAGGSGAGGTGGGIIGVDPGSPVIFYTDLASAPPGAYVTLWGNGFGDTQGTGSVTLAGAPIATVVSWSMRMLELKLPANPAAGDLVVTTDSGASPPMPLGIHSGVLYFVSPSGNDSWSGTSETASGNDGPFQSLTAGRSALAPGDVLYVRAGTYTGEDNYNAVLSLYDVPSGSAAAPIAIVGYPSEDAIIGDHTLSRSFSLYTGDGGPPLDYLVFAKLDLRPSCDGIELLNGDHGRFVGNEISGATDACQNGVIEAQGTSDWKILGNYLHDNGNTKLEHGVYLGGYGSQSGWEIAWNRIQNQSGGRAIQLYGHTTDDHIAGVSIHDNEILDIDRDGIVLGATDADVLHLSDISIVNNIFVRAGRCVGAGVRVDNDTATGITILHNTFFDDGAGNVACDQSSGELGSALLFEMGVAVSVSNNLIVAQGSEPYLDEQTAPGVVGGSNNLFFGNGAAPSWDAAAQTGDPLLVNAAGLDLHLSPGSPAIDHAASSSVAADHDGVKRPQGAAPDIGAYEWFAPQ
jgi:hypothetical protein